GRLKPELRQSHLCVSMSLRLKKEVESSPVTGYPLEIARSKGKRRGVFGANSLPPRWLQRPALRPPRPCAFYRSLPIIIKVELPNAAFEAHPNNGRTL